MTPGVDRALTSTSSTRSGQAILDRRRQVTPYVEEWAGRLDESIGGNDVSERLAAARRKLRP
ncbi:MAG: hypothetical protein U0166_01955 [Acidobacteriota bacterium]